MKQLLPAILSLFFATNVLAQTPRSYSSADILQQINKLEVFGSVLYIAAHPDDVELSASGVILKYKKLGKKIGIVDLTRGELGTRGSGLIRAEEAAQAAKILGLDVRINLDFKDAFFINDEEHQKIVIAAIRKYQPEIVITNAYHDRHPDHGRASVERQGQADD